ncbi:MAG: ATP-binding cassette domain-containing protein [Bacteroidia bacterium]|jgi:ABC-2 type transport system ATP-binding protein|nr:ATP-binding cassette domain-containing protein [Bacteroidia bacterium]
MSNLLTAKNIIKRYSGHTALDDVSITVPEGCVYGLLGPNGAGKTTLIRIINQITGPDSGHVLFEDRLLDAEHVRQIGYLPEERGLYRKMPIGEQAIYLARLKGLSATEAKKRVREWFERFGIEGWWKKKVEELSKGMQQKVQFIVTVLHEPRLLILDEPFSGFDPINAQLIRDELLRLRERGATIILSTHNMGSVEELCDHIALINKSKNILEGRVKDIRRSYSMNLWDISFRGNLMGFTNAMWTGAELISQTEDEDHRQVRIKLLGNTSPNQLLQAVMSTAEITGFQEVLPTMNDVFIRKVNETNGMQADAAGTKSNYTE